MIPQFPKFKKLELDDKNSIVKIAEKFHPYSDFNFTSMWNYNIDNKVEISILNNNLVVKFYDYINNKPFLSFIGNTRVVNTTDLLFEYFDLKGFSRSLKLIPEETAKADKRLRKKYHVKVDKKNYDYILSIQKLAYSKGQKYASKRKAARRFEKNYPENQFILADIAKKPIIEQIKKTFHSWAYHRKKTKKQYINEYKALLRFINNRTLNHHFCCAIILNKKMVGFSIFEKDRHQLVQNHFMKTVPVYKGLYECLDIKSANYLLSKGYLYINIQQDLGIKGLHVAKLLCRPMTYYKKYKISRK